jgi:hypothetical protein
MVPNGVISALLFCRKLLEEPVASPVVPVKLGLEMLDRPLDVNKVLGIDFSADEGN